MSGERSRDDSLEIMVDMTDGSVMSRGIGGGNNVTFRYADNNMCSISNINAAFRRI